MAKGRMLNRDVSISAKFDALKDDTARMFATWTIPWLDKNGVFHAAPQIVRAHVTPLRDDLTAAKVSAILDDMERVGLMRRFESAGRRWQVWPGFAHNQPNLRGERERTDYPPPPTARENPATASQLPDINGQKTIEVQVEVEVEPKQKENAGKPARRPAGFASVHTSHEDARVAAYLDLLGQKQITDTNAALIMERVGPNDIEVWREVLTAWAVGGERGPYVPTNFSGMFDRYDSAKNARRFPKASVSGNGKHAMPDIVDGAREILRQRAAARGETI